MSVHHDETQQLLAETTRRFLDDRSPVARTRALLDDERGWDPAVWSAGAELGWPGLAVPEAHGGMADDAGPRVADLAVVAGELGAVVLPGPFLPTCVVAAAIAAVGRDDQRKELLGPLASGELTAAWGFAADPALADAGAPELVVEAARDGVRVRGTQRFVADAATAGVLLLTGRDGDGWTQVVVPSGVPGVTVVPLQALDITRRLADVVVDATLPSTALLGTAGGASAAIDRQLDLAVVLQSAETVGAAERLLEVTVAYARERLAFGRPIGSYQAIKHLLAELLLALEVAKAAVALGVRAVAGGDPVSSARASSVAKAAVHEACATVAEGCLQVHGGIGFTWEHDVHLYLRRVRGNEALWGSPAWHRERVAGTLGLDGAPRDATAVATTGEADAGADDVAPGDDDEAYRSQVRRWLADNLPRRPAIDEAGAMTLEEELAAVERARVLQAILHAGGYGGITFPTTYGGAGLTLRHQQIFDAEAAEYERPLLFRVPTLSIIAPTILAHASEEQKRRHLPEMIAGRELWVQLMSEPSGGSDLAGALTRATRDGDVFVVNGQKVWSTGAHYVDFGLCLVRTDPDVPKHRGLTMLIIPLRAPGVTSVPIRQINGQAEFCEVFFDDVVVPVENVVGAVNDGWTVASNLLVHERSAAGQTRKADVTADLVALARQRGKAGDPTARQLVAQVHERASVEPELLARISAEMRAGEKPSTAGSLVKLFRAQKAQFAGHAGMRIAGAHGVAWHTDEPGGERWSDDYLNSRARSIAGGTSEMQRNIISERVLGLPREAQPDRDVPFSQARSNSLPTRRGAPTRS